MSDKTDQLKPSTSSILDIELSEIGSAHAPIIYFESASAFGHLNGVMRITLEAIRTVPNGQGISVKNDRIITAHLRMSIPAAHSLKEALEGALLLSIPAKSTSKN